MGIGFVLIIWAVVGVVLAGIGALVCAYATALLTRGAVQDRKKLIKTATLFPFACLVWTGTVFVFQAVINETVLHRDAGIGDSWKCPLPNGYALLMTDLTDEGFVYDPKTQPGDAVGAQEDAVDGVRVLQVSGRYILGGSDSQWFEHLQNDKGAVDSYFLLDVQLGKHTNFSSYDALRAMAKEMGLDLNLQPIVSIYRRYRLTWFDVLAGLLLLVPPVAGATFLVRWIFLIRRARGEALPT
jgi:hypothetical protein